MASPYFDDLETKVRNYLRRRLCADLIIETSAGPLADLSQLQARTNVEFRVRIVNDGPIDMTGVTVEIQADPTYGRVRRDSEQTWHNTLTVGPFGVKAADPTTGNPTTAFSQTYVFQTLGPTPGPQRLLTVAVTSWNAEYRLGDITRNNPEYWEAEAR